MPGGGVSHRIDTQLRAQLADALPEHPYTVIPAHLLRRGLCRAYVDGDIPGFRAALIQDDAAADEPSAFGDDARAIWRLLQDAPEWECVSVPAHVAEELAAIIQLERGVDVRYYADVYYQLTRPVVGHPHRDVRLLTPADVGLLRSAPEGLRGYGFGGPDGLLADGCAAAAVVEGRIAAVAQTYARTRAHADIGVHTAKACRRRGYATSAAALVIAQVQAVGETPVWSCGGDNHASMRVAEKLGFERCGERTYVIPIG
jgi:hypothetical protein